MKKRNIYFVLCTAYFVIGTGAAYGAQVGRFTKFAAAARIAAIQAFKHNSLVRKAIAGANILAHNTYSHFNKHSFLKSVLPVPQKKILEIGTFTLAQENGIDPMTGEEKPFYTMVYCDGKISKGEELGNYFFNLHRKLSTDTLHLSPAENNKLALATLNSHPEDVINSLYFSSIIPYLTSETDRVFYTQKLIDNGKIRNLHYSELEKIFELLPWQYRPRLAAECLNKSHFSTFLLLPSIVFLIKQLWMEQDAFSHAKKLLKSNLLLNQRLDENLITIQNIIDIFTTPEQKNRFSLYCFKDLFSLNANDALVLIEQLLLSSDKAECAERYIVSENSYYQSKSFLMKFFEYMPSNRKNLIASRDLEKSFEKLSNHHSYLLCALEDRIDVMIRNLTVEADIFKYLEKKMDIPEIRVEQFCSLLDHLTNEQKNRFALKKLKKSFDILSGEHIACMVQRLSCEKGKACYVEKFIDSRKYITFEPGQLEKFCGSFAQPILEKSFDSLSELQVGVLIPRLPLLLQAEWFKKLVSSEKTTFLSLCSPTTPTQGPLFSNYSLTRLPRILGWMAHERYHTSYLKNKKSREHFFDRIIKFTEGEYHKDRIVLYHGQNDLWAFLEKIFKTLLLIKGVETPEKFVWLRFTLRELLTEEQVAEIRAHGTYGKSGQEFKTYRFKMFFTNLHLLANQSGSNSLLYTLSNSDQSAGSRFDFDKGMSDLFAELDMMEVYKKLRTEDHDLFNRLYDLYKKEVYARGGVGRLIAFSLPRSSARALCYPTVSGGGVRPLKINGELTTDITKISDHFSQVPDLNEFALIADKRITDPKEAAQAGVVMETFTSAPTEGSQLYAQELDVEFNKMSERVAQLLNEHA